MENIERQEKFMQHKGVNTHREEGEKQDQEENYCDDLKKKKIMIIRMRMKTRVRIRARNG